VISKPFLYFIVIAVLIVLGLAWWAGNFPARVTVINNSGVDLPDVSIETRGQRVDLGAVINGGAKSAQLDPGDRVTIHYGEKRWTSDTKLTPAQSMIAYVTPTGRIELRSRLGTLAR
jgi:hypothetical protein